jgi:hypothetical protein
MSASRHQFKTGTAEKKTERKAKYRRLSTPAAKTPSPVEMTCIFPYRNIRAFFL